MNIVNITPRATPIEIYSTGSCHFGSLCLLLDISKIVTTANSEDELQQNLELVAELKRELPIPSLFLCNGSHCRIHRIYGPMFGVCMYLAAIQKKEWESQPTLNDVKTAMTLAGYENLPW